MNAKIGELLSEIISIPREIWNKWIWNSLREEKLPKILKFKKLGKNQVLTSLEIINLKGMRLNQA